jgi:hypothetical protein
MRTLMPSHRSLLLLVLGGAFIACSGYTGPAGGSASLTWAAPTQNLDGSPLGQIKGYYIYYGTSPTVMGQTVKVSDPKATSYVVKHLSPGTWYFSVAAYTAAGAGAQTPVVSKTVGP